MLFQGVEFSTVNPATSPTTPHTKLTTHIPSLISPPSLSLSLSLSHVCIYSCSYTAWSLTFTEHKQALHMWQVITVLLDCCCVDGTDCPVFLYTFLSVSPYHLSIFAVLVCHCTLSS